MQVTCDAVTRHSYNVSCITFYVSGVEFTAIVKLSVRRDVIDALWRLNTEFKHLTDLKSDRTCFPCPFHFLLALKAGDT